MKKPIDSTSLEIEITDDGRLIVFKCPCCGKALKPKFSSKLSYTYLLFCDCNPKRIYSQNQVKYMKTQEVLNLFELKGGEKEK